MKKLHIFRYLFLGVLVLALTQSCTDLEEELFDTVTGDNFFKTDEEFIAALGAAYTSLYAIGNHNTYMSSNEVASDEIMIPQRGQDWFDGGVWLRQHRHEYNEEEGQLNNSWNTLYGGVNNCNRLIAQFEGLANPDTDPFIAELKVLRAYFYWQLLDMFGNIPVVTSFADADPNPSTVDRAQVYDFIVGELTTEVPKLTKAKDGTTYGRVNYYVGQMLLAKLYLNAGVYSGRTGEWANAAAACDEIINSGLYSLEADYFANFNADNSGSSENIFAVPYDEVFATGFNLPMMTLHYLSQDTWNFTAQPWNGYCSLSEFYNSYDDTDLRKGEWGNQKIRGNFIAGPQYAADGVTQLIDNGAEANDPDGQGLVFTPELNEHFPNALRQAGVRVGKFEFYNGGRDNLNNDFPIFRYSDVLLMKAEALWHQNAGDATALALVNQVRARAGQPDFTELTADNLLAERGREMFYENHRRTDLIRFDAYNDAWEFKPASDPSKNIFPIPRAQLDANPNLRQNPGY
ncbi:MAG: RagB/SusD family nutrient uptake outer membrane protein [Saprospiraceae bacterium]|nr:RagB/SusD family nutrient uptake outer membrane protein [Lewinella sp.]